MLVFAVCRVCVHARRLIEPLVCSAPAAFSHINSVLRTNGCCGNRPRQICLNCSTRVASVRAVGTDNIAHTHHRLERVPRGLSALVSNDRHANCLHSQHRINCALTKHSLTGRKPPPHQTPTSISPWIGCRTDRMERKRLGMTVMILSVVYRICCDVKDMCESHGICLIEFALELRNRSRRCSKERCHKTGSMS